MSVVQVWSIVVRGKQTDFEVPRPRLSSSYSLTLLSFDHRRLSQPHI